MQEQSKLYNDKLNRELMEEVKRKMTEKANEMHAQFNEDDLLFAFRIMKDQAEEEVSFVFFNLGGF